MPGSMPPLDMVRQVAEILKRLQRLERATAAPPPSGGSSGFTTMAQFAIFTDVTNGQVSVPHLDVGGNVTVSVPFTGPAGWASGEIALTVHLAEAVTIEIEGYLHTLAMDGSEMVAHYGAVSVSTTGEVPYTTLYINTGTAFPVDSFGYCSPDGSISFWGTGAFSVTRTA